MAEKVKAAENTADGRSEGCLISVVLIQSSAGGSGGVVTSQVTDLDRAARSLRPRRKTEALAEAMATCMDFSQQ